MMSMSGTPTTFDRARSSLPPGRVIRLWDCLPVATHLSTPVRSGYSTPAVAPSRSTAWALSCTPRCRGVRLHSGVDLFRFRLPRAKAPSSPRPANITLTRATRQLSGQTYWTTAAWGQRRARPRAPATTPPSTCRSTASRPRTWIRVMFWTRAALTSPRSIIAMSRCSGGSSEPPAWKIPGPSPSPPASRRPGAAGPVHRAHRGGGPDRSRRVAPWGIPVRGPAPDPDARELRDHGGTARTRVDPPGADPGPQDGAHREGAGRGRPRDAALPRGGDARAHPRGDDRGAGGGPGALPQRLPLPRGHLGGCGDHPGVRGRRGDADAGRAPVLLVCAVRARAQADLLRGRFS